MFNSKAIRVQEDAFFYVQFEKVKWTCWARLRSFRDYWPTVVEEIGCRLVGSFDAVGKRETV